MGFFSWNCEVCKQSIKAPYEYPPELTWHTQAVAIMPDGTVYEGLYDGYGRINDDEDSHDLQAQKPPYDPHDGREDWKKGEPTVYHADCYAKAGKPTEYKGPSDNADDQGFFYSNAEAVEAADDYAESQKVKP